MRYPKGTPTHGKIGCCPNDWNRTPEISGLYTLDEVILRNSNKNIPDRLKLYCGNYGNRTAYNAYSGDK